MKLQVWLNEGFHVRKSEKEEKYQEINIAENAELSFRRFEKEPKCYH
jgi:hypothetical protein